MIAWPAIVTWIKGVPSWLWMALLALMGIWAANHAGRRSGKQAQELKQERQEAVVRKEAEAHVREVVTEERKRADDARETVSSGRLPDSRRMSDEEFRLFFGYDRPPEEAS